MRPTWRTRTRCCTARNRSCTATPATTGLGKREDVTQAQRDGRLRKSVQWKIAMKRGTLQAMPDGPLKALTEWAERRKAQVRSIVEHPFHVIKNLFRYRKVSYRGLRKNH